MVKPHWLAVQHCADNTYITRLPPELAYLFAIKALHGQLAHVQLLSNLQSKGPNSFKLGGA